MTPPAAGAVLAPAPARRPRPAPMPAPRPARRATPGATPARVRPPRRVSGPARVIQHATAVADRTLLDRLVHSRAWIALIAAALIGLVAIQVVVLKLNTGIGRALQREAQLQRLDAQIGVEDSVSSSGDRVEPLASAAGMTIAAPSALHFVGVQPSDVAKAAAALAAPIQTPAGTSEQSAGETAQASSASAGAEGKGSQESAATAATQGATESSTSRSTENVQASSTSAGAEATSVPPASSATAGAESGQAPPAPAQAAQGGQAPSASAGSEGGNATVTSAGATAAPQG
jgi:hypothetical protein